MVIKSHHDYLLTHNITIAGVDEVRRQCYVIRWHLQQQIYIDACVWVLIFASTQHPHRLFSISVALYLLKATLGVELAIGARPYAVAIQVSTSHC
jgi:hypothetical protein